MVWLLEVLRQFVEAVISGDKSWWPFVIGVLLVGISFIAMKVWLRGHGLGG